MAVLPDHGVRRDVPDLGGARAELLDGIARGDDGGQAGGEGAAAAVGHVVVAERAGVGDDGAHLARRECRAPRPPSGTCEAREPPMSGVPTASATVPSALMLSDDAGLAAEIEPEAAGHAAALVLAERRLVVRMRSWPPPASRPRPIGPIDRAVGGLGAFLGRVLEAEIERIHADLLGQFVDHALDREGRHRRAGRAIGGLLRPVARRRRSRRP